MPKPISRAEASAPRIVMVTMDEEMLDRMAHLDRTAVATNADRLIQAQGRPCGSQSTDALRRADNEFGNHIEDNVEGAAA